MAKLIKQIDRKLIKLDLKDQKLLYELSKNSRQNISKIAKKIGCSKQTTKYRLDKLIKLGLIKKFITLINNEKINYDFYNIYLKIDRMNKKKENHFCNIIRKDSSINRMLSGHGNFNYIISILAKDNKDFNKNLLRILNKASSILKNNTLFITTETYQTSHNYLFKNKNLRYNVFNHIKNKENIRYKRIDLKILQKLAEDARISNIELTKKLKISRNRIKYKIDRMEKSGLIKAYIPLLNVRKLGYEWFAVFLNLKNINKEKENNFIKFLKSISYITYIAKGIGRWNLILDLYAKDMEHFNRIKYEIIDKFPDVIKSYDYIYVVKEHKCNLFPQTIFQK